MADGIAFVLSPCITSTLHGKAISFGSLLLPLRITSQTDAAFRKR